MSSCLPQIIICSFRQQPMFSPKTQEEGWLHETKCQKWVIVRLLSPALITTNTLQSFFLSPPQFTNPSFFFLILCIEPVVRTFLYCWAAKYYVSDNFSNFDFARIPILAWLFTQKKDVKAISSTQEWTSLFRKTSILQLRIVSQIVQTIKTVKSFTFYLIHIVITTSLNYK